MAPTSHEPAVGRWGPCAGERHATLILICECRDVACRRLGLAFDGDLLIRALPRLEHGSSTWQLPLTDYAAEHLAEALLQDDRQRRVASLAELLGGEPTLLLWACCRAGRWQSEPPQDLQAVAAWLADHAPRVLQWDDGEQDQLLPVQAETIQRWTQLAAESVAIASCAARLADEAPGGRAYLCGLLSTAGSWLESCRGPLNASHDCRPAWLGAWTQPTGVRYPEGSPARFAAQARQQLSEAAGVQDDPQTVAALASARIAADEIGPRWQDETNAWGRQLPRLMRRLGRLEELESEFQQALEREKLDALKEFAYGASHEINNPLANISTRAQTLMREETDPERRRKLAVINAQAFRAHEMISDMMLFARPPKLEREAVELTALVSRVIRELRDEAAAQGTVVEQVAVEPLTILADANHLAVALKSLCTNSLEAVRAGGRVEIRVQRVPASAEQRGAWVEISVCDDGPGIGPEVRRHLFDPYFSGREAGRGLGLGLSKCWRIVTEHGGRIEVTDREKQGAQFSIRLPAGVDSSAAPFALGP